MHWKEIRKTHVIYVQIIKVIIIKANENVFAEAICFYFNKALENGKFPNCLKLANITPAFKKGSCTSKNN